MTTLTQQVLIGRAPAVFNADGSSHSRPRLLEIDAGPDMVTLNCDGSIRLDRQGVTELIEMLAAAEKEML